MLIYKDIDIDLSLNEILKVMPGMRTNEKTINIIENCWTKSKKILSPRAAGQWLLVKEILHGKAILTDNTGTNSTILNMGFSSRFLKGAKKAMLSVYSIGEGLEQESIRLSSESNYLESYIYDIIGLVALEKTGLIINTTVEEEALKSDWGVSPFLSPGSVHGWELTDQHSLCSTVPLNKIDVGIRDDGILLPFKSISCLIAIGPEYKSKSVGSTCEVCSKRNKCQLGQKQ